jgi:F-type H+-transporting ATPase subunit gamma
MAQIREIKNRIVSVKKTQQITRAMKMIAGVKFRKADTYLKAIRPYAEMMNTVALSVAKRNRGTKNEFYQKTSATKGQDLLLVISGDRGLCGNYNSSIFRFVQNKLKQDSAIRDCVFVGTKGKAVLGKNSSTTKASFDNLGPEQELDYFNNLAKTLMDLYCDYDCVHIVFTRYVNAVTRELEIKQLFPMVMQSDKRKESVIQVDYLYELDEEEVLKDLLMAYVTSCLRHCLAESAVSEESARMAAMDSATNNADDIIRSLILAYNRVRQAGITTEIIEISSGAEALANA